MVSFEDMIAAAVRNVIQEEVQKISMHQFQLVDIKSLAKLLSSSETNIKRMIADGVLKEGIHYTNLTKGGHIRFNLATIQATLFNGGKTNEHQRERKEKGNLPFL